MHTDSYVSKTAFAYEESLLYLHAEDTGAHGCLKVVFRVVAFAVSLLATSFYLYLTMVVFGSVFSFFLRVMAVIWMLLASVATALFLHRSMQIHHIL